MALIALNRFLSISLWGTVVSEPCDTFLKHFVPLAGSFALIGHVLSSNTSPSGARWHNDPHPIQEMPFLRAPDPSLSAYTEKLCE